MPIIYALVSRGTCVLAEHTTTSGNFTTITRRLLEKIPPEAQRMSYVYDRHVFHFLVERGLVFLCMSDEEFGTRVPFLFLEGVKARWFSTYGERGASALAYGMNEDFSPVISGLMDQHSSDAAQELDSVSRVRGEIAEVRSVMVQNIERVLERGEKIELLVDRTENLSAQAFRFKRQSAHLRRALWWKNARVVLALLALVAFVALLVTMGACGVTFRKCAPRRGKAPL